MKQWEKLAWKITVLTTNQPCHQNGGSINLNFHQIPLYFAIKYNPTCFWNSYLYVSHIYIYFFILCQNISQSSRILMEKERGKYSS